MTIRFFSLLMIVLIANQNCFGQADRIDNKISSAPMVVLTYTIDQLGIDRGKAGQISRAAVSLSPGARLDPKPSEIGGGARGRVREQKHYDGPPIWKLQEDLLYAEVSPAAQKLHRQFTFQYLAANAKPNGAIRYAGIRLNEKDIKAVDAEMLKLRKQLLIELQRDRILLSADCLSPLKPYNELLEAIGEIYVFKGGMANPVELDGKRINKTPVSTAAAISTELKLSPKQLSEIQTLQSRGLQPGLSEEELRIEKESAEFGDPCAFVSVEEELTPAQAKERSKELLRDVRALLDEDQKVRFNQVLLQRYLLFSEMRSAVSLLGLEIPKTSTKKGKELREKYRWHGADYQCAQQFRGWKIFEPLVKKYLEPDQFAKLTMAQYRPDAVGGGEPPLEARLFKEFTFEKSMEENPRR